MIDTIFQEIYSIFNELKGAGKPFVDVYDYVPADPDTFPFVSLLDGETGEQVDEASALKVLNLNFTVFCLYRQKGTAESRKQIREDLWTVYQKFTEKGIADYMNDKVKKMDITHEMVNITEAKQPMTGFALKISCQILMDII